MLSLLLFYHISNPRPWRESCSFTFLKTWNNVNPFWSKSYYFIHPQSRDMRNLILFILLFEITPWGILIFALLLISATHPQCNHCFNHIHLRESSVQLSPLFIYFLFRSTFHCYFSNIDCSCLGFHWIFKTIILNLFI